MRLPRKPLAVAFDLDGTLIDSESLIKESYFAVAGDFGVSMSEQQFLSLVGLPRNVNDERLRKLYGEDFPLENFYAAARAHIGDRVAPLKPGATELLDELETLAVPRAMVTSSGRPWLQKHFTAHRLADRFSVVIARGDYVNGKPDPEPYIKAVSALGISADAVLALEDSPIGVTAAHAAGLMTVMIPDLLQADDALRAKTVHVARDLHELIPMMNA
jgi:HAD superfamily hydrolase (TIGR01509 family)